MFLHDAFTLFFFNDTATTEIYTLSLHDALPIYPLGNAELWDTVLLEAVYTQENLDLYLNTSVTDVEMQPETTGVGLESAPRLDRKSTRLNSSHANISYAVFCLKKRKRTRLTSSQ